MVSGTVVSGPVVSGGAQDANEDAGWVDDFLRTEPGKTYRTEMTEDAHEAAVREAVQAAGRSLTDEVMRAAQVAAQVAAPGKVTATDSPS